MNDMSDGFFCIRRRSRAMDHLADIDPATNGTKQPIKDPRCTNIPYKSHGFCKVIHIHIYTYFNKYFTCYLTLLLEYLYLHTKLNKNFQTFEVTDVSPCLLLIY